MNKKLAIILSSYNRPKLLQKSLDSIYSQTFTDWELYVCDDASTNKEVLRILDNIDPSYGTVIRGKQYSHEDKQTKVCTFSKLINQALDMTNSKFISYLVDDVYYYPDRCEKMVDYLVSNRGCFAVWGQQDMYKMVFNNEHSVRKSKPNNNGLEHWKGSTFVNRLQRYNFINHCSVMHRRTDLRWTEDPKHWHDIDRQFWMECGRNNLQFDFNPSIVGESMHTGDGNIGPELFKGKGISDISASRS